MTDHYADALDNEWDLEDLMESSDCLEDRLDVLLGSKEVKPCINGWVHVDTDTPDYEKDVLIICESGSQRVAFFVGEKTTSTLDRPFEGDTEYDDETDQSYWPEGWYSFEDGSDLYMQVLNTVTHWQPLPLAPVVTL